MLSALLTVFVATLIINCPLGVIVFKVVIPAKAGRLGDAPGRESTLFNNGCPTKNFGRDELVEIFVTVDIRLLVSVAVNSYI
jgi:hypothetical protein